MTRMACQRFRCSLSVEACERYQELFPDACAGCEHIGKKVQGLKVCIKCENPSKKVVARGYCINCYDKARNAGEFVTNPRYRGVRKSPLKLTLIFKTDVDRKTLAALHKAAKSSGLSVEDEALYLIERGLTK